MNLRAQIGKRNERNAIRGEGGGGGELDSRISRKWTLRTNVNRDLLVRDGLFCSIEIFIP